MTDGEKLRLIANICRSTKHKNPIRDILMVAESGVDSYSPIDPPVLNSTERNKFIANLDVAILFHFRNSNDPHGVSLAVMCALREVKEAFENATTLTESPMTDSDPWEGH